MNRGSVGLRAGDRYSADKELFTAIRKASSADETAPKQKHVRKIIVYTWDFKTSQPVWDGLRSQVSFSNEISVFKAIITIHKFIRNGAPVCIVEALQNINFLEGLGKFGQQKGGWKGYGVLIRAYVNYVLAKLEYHKLHPEFNGCFDYEEYVSLRGTYDPNEGYETIADLMSLQDRLDELQKIIFRNFTPGSNNECKIAALVPLVEESYGIYKFATRMLIAMHQRVDDAESALEPLRERFNSQHDRLRNFYTDCSKLSYLTSLITVPKLQRAPPNLMEGEITIPAEGESSRKSPVASRDTSDKDRERMLNEQRRLEEEARQRKKQLEEERAEQERKMLDEQARELKRYEDEKNMMEAAALQQQRMMEEQAQEQLRIERERLLMEQRALEQQQQFEELQRQRKMAEQLQLEQQRQAMGRMMETEAQLKLLRETNERNNQAIAAYASRIQMLEQQMAQQAQLHQQSDASKDEIIKALQAQIEEWRQKYEALASLYSQLRQEHLGLLGKYKDSTLRAAEMEDELRFKVEQLQEFIKSKNTEVVEMISQRDEARDEVERVQREAAEERERYERQLQERIRQLQEKTEQFEHEISELGVKLTTEKNTLESQLDQYRRDLEQRSVRIAELESTMDHSNAEKDEEIAVLQAGMDQSILALANYQKQMATSKSDVDAQLRQLSEQHAEKMAGILDSIMQTCEDRVRDSVYEFGNAANTGIAYATPALALVQTEDAQYKGNSLSSAFSGYLVGSSSDQTPVIRAAIDLASSMAVLLPTIKGLFRFCPSFDESERLGASANAAAEICMLFFTNIQSTSAVAPASRSGVVVDLNRNFAHRLGGVSALVEKLVERENKPPSTDLDLADAVEAAMLNAASTIEAAKAKLQAMMTVAIPNLSDAKLNINENILDYSMRLADAISRLIRAATASQNEIVAAGRGSASKTAFYKQHNRWTEGLISAAKAVAIATNILVETADAVINDTKAIEDLIVAAREVSASTVQLLAASRVKSQLHSPCQLELEAAAKAVTDTSHELVAVVSKLAEHELADQHDPERQRQVFEGWTVYEYKSKEMEQQVEILKLEKDLTNARRKLADMRRYGYHNIDDSSI